jgi:hypothetical protein
MSERNYMATNNVIAVSALLRELAINTEKALDTTMLWNLASLIDLDPRRQNNDSEAHGKEEVDLIYDRGNLAIWPAAHDMTQPQNIAFLMAYAMGAVSSVPAGIGYKHTITPIAGALDANRDNPSFTAAQRYGQQVARRLFASMFVDSVTTTFARDSFVKIAGSVKGTGKYTDNVVEETVSLAGNATALTLATRGVEGSTAALRLANVQRIKVKLSTGVWTEVVYTAVSAATPAIITIVAPAVAATAVDFKILYIPTEADWMTFPARVNESPLEIAQTIFNVGGTWTGAAFEGGRSLSSEIKSLEHTFNNNGEVQFVPGAGGMYGGRYMRGGRMQTIKLDREFRDFILKRHVIDNDTFGIYVKAVGAMYDATYYYQTEYIFPKVAVLKAPITVDGKRLAEAGDLQVLEDDTYGSSIVTVQNLQPTYAA